MNAPDKNGMFDCPDCFKKVPFVFRINSKGEKGVFVCKKCAAKYDDFDPTNDAVKITELIGRRNEVS